jgi:hypothetical protein
VSRYRIEFLKETTEETSVLGVVMVADGCLEDALRVGAGHADDHPEAEGFQVRDMNEDGRIVALETFFDA